ncbi:calcyclin-binding protein-like [Oppia nitens]|uniref:calcyclin-binding protein-like n=1 Tax=Oppia nitens TaxID=1686743 RepID=UPI0023D9916B|nr:calcyclin-binding protein-like [Oppia nitens]
MADQITKNIQQIEFDLSELSSMELTAKRPNVKALLATEMSRLTLEKSELLAKRKLQQQKQTADSLEKTTGDVSRGSVTVNSYLWDQTDDFVKVYLEVNDKQTDLKSLPIDLTFSANAMGLTVIFGKYRFSLNRLYAAIVPDDSYHKVTKSATKLIIYLKKAVTKKQWPSIDEQKSKLKDPIGDTNTNTSSSSNKDEMNAEDPSAGLMKLMKQMYDEGDDDMKRTIAKSWYESRNKTSDGGLDDPMSQMFDTKNLGI